MLTPVALTIAGSDPSGGAGIQADLKTFHQFRVYGEAAVTLLTVQNTRSVSQVQTLEPGFVAAQIRAVVDDIAPGAVKTGALGTAEIIGAVASFDLPHLVVDPVMISKHGAPLMAEEARVALRTKLLPKAALVTPNLPETWALIGRETNREDAARAIADMGAKAVLIKGGHGDGPAMDLLYVGGRFVEFTAARVATAHTHGTGCSYSAAITALLARGEALEPAVRIAKQWITEAIRTNPSLGHGNGPVNHFARAANDFS